MKRRDFLKNSVAASALVTISYATSSRGAEAKGGGEREFYELRRYRLKEGSGGDNLAGYLEKAAVPAWNRLGVAKVGVFRELEPKDGPATWVLMAHKNLNEFARVATELDSDAKYQEAGASYLQAAKNSPNFERIDSWLYLAFAGMPRMELPDYSVERKPRLFELRTYESHSEEKARKKVEMFNAGEIQVMREVKLGPVFYGQGLVGRDLPHLTYMLSAEDRDAHKQHWGGFGKNPIWNKLKDDPQYADTVSKITSRMLQPLEFSQI
jgi:hypothetical protein